MLISKENIEIYQKRVSGLLKTFSMIDEDIACFNYIDDIYMVYPKSRQYLVKQLRSFLIMNDLTPHDISNDSKCWIAENDLEFEKQVYKISKDLYRQMMMIYCEQILSKEPINQFLADGLKLIRLQTEYENGRAPKPSFDWHMNIAIDMQQIRKQALAESKS